MERKENDMLNKTDFIARLAGKGYTKKDAESIVNDFLDTLTQAMVAGESVQFYGFGTFAVRDSAAREAVDMHTKERIVIPGHKAPKFTPGKLLRRAVKEGIIRE